MSYNPLLEEQVAESVAETDINAVDGEALIAPKPELPEAPLSFNIIGYYKGFRVGTTIRLEQNGTIPTGKVVSLIDGLIELGFKPSWNDETNKSTLTPATESGPVCGIHGKPMVHRVGISKSTNKPYDFWACTEKFANGDYCNYKPEKKNES